MGAQNWLALLKGRRESKFVNSASGVGVRAISGLTRIGILLAIARAYGPEPFGKLSFALSIVEILRIFSEFGIDTISIRKFTELPPAGRARLLEKILGAKLLLTACFYSAGAGLLMALARNRLEVLLGLVAGLSIFFSGATGAFLSYFQSFFLMSRMLKITLLSSSASVICSGLLIHYKLSLLLVVAALPLADALNFTWVCATSELRLRARFDLRQSLALLRESLPVGITAALVILYFRLDTLFVFKFAGAAALGLYSACFRITEAVLMVPYSFSTTTYTVLSMGRGNNEGVGDLLETVLHTMWPAFALIGLFTLTSLVAGKALLSWLLPMYLPAYTIMAVLSITLLIRSANMGLTAILNSRAMYSTMTRIAVLNLCLNLVLVLFLTPKYGALGAAWAALLTESGNTLMQGRSLVSALHVSKASLVTGHVNIEG